MIRKKQTLWLAALLVGWGFDFFYWDKPLGISFFLHIVIAIAALLFVSREEEKQPARRSLWLLIPLLLFSVLTFIRQEPFTRVLNHGSTLILGMVFLLTFRGGRWPQYRLVEYILGWVKLLFNMVILPFRLLIDNTEKEQEESEEPEKEKARWKNSLPFLRGLLIAIPVLAVFAALFASADPIFADRLQAVIEYLHLEKIPEYIARGVLIMIWTFLVSGLMLSGLLKSKDETLIGDENAWPPRFLGSTEASIILGSVNLLFFSFVLIQFRYFFGGESNISLEGFTYAEYARRGFGELLAVALISLLLFMVMSAITRRRSRRETIIFTSLTVTLTLLVGIIIISSMFRLRLYETAYGFTRLRTYAHICILWIGVLFTGVLILEIFHKWRYFTLAAAMAILGFVLTLNAINVDAFIARQNFLRAADEQRLDTNYLNRLSNDAVATLIRFADSPWLTSEQQRDVKISLACRAGRLNAQNVSWRGFLWSRFSARQALNAHQDRWDAFRVRHISDTWYIHEDGIRERCPYTGR